MEIRDRFKLVREALGLSQAEFGQRLSLERSTISLIERKQRNLTDRTIKDVSREFRIDPLWLDNGEGEMFLEQEEDDEVTKFLAKVAFGENKFHQNLFKTFARMDQSEWDALEGIVDKYLEVSGKKIETD
ncbi:helix-turn-helix transcriptional regulator [Enterococcus sp. BWM-S5]|uniref:Helix-turn-helix transcriptional regulator n=1 Tax=Enterococcus larvae TaxID=2794352 RepID=A0ABS4CFH6_9ENTE|nr:helix-turn-helix transcriptional regulator [Enterococcus larvae]MBP1045302.1 helix-turn-helix transcriptional regulator [Enterococcus larvae]